ncbi:MAG: NAD(P)H-dependent oxidoreductase [Phycisphaerales bacterium]
MSTPKVLVFAGSLRAASFNHRLAVQAAKAVDAHGGQATLVRLRDYPLPIYDGDIEANGLPENAVKLKQLFWSHQGLLIASPEYNSSVSGALKNAIDWVSRQGGWAESGRQGVEPGLSCFEGKAASLVSASPGKLGGLRGLVHLRAILGNIGVLVLPAQLSVSAANEAFTPDGALVDHKQQATLDKIAGGLVRTLGRLHV